MEFKNVYLGRRAIRRYKDKDVSMDLVGEIIDLAGFAPSSGNVQNWRFVVVTDKKKRQDIADACLEQNWMLEAPIFIIVCNNYKDVEAHYGKLGKMYSIQNCAAVSLGIMLAAYHQGLGSCWIGAFDNEAVQRILDIPQDMDPEIIITLGYTDEVKKPALREDPRYITFFNTWGSTSTNFPSHVEKLKSMLDIKKQIQKLKKNY